VNETFPIHSVFQLSLYFHRSTTYPIASGKFIRKSLHDLRENFGSQSNTLRVSGGAEPGLNKLGTLKLGSELQGRQTNCNTWSNTEPFYPANATWQS